MAVTLNVTFCVISPALAHAPQDRLPKSDTVAPRIGQYGPAQADMIASQSADLTLWGPGVPGRTPFPAQPGEFRFPGDIRAREGGPRCLSTSESMSIASVPR